MTVAIDTLSEIAGRFDAIVLDQWGVLHNGAAAYPGAVTAVRALKDLGVTLAVLSNSGKRAAVNAARISEMGFDMGLFDLVMTSGEALWRDAAAGRLTTRCLFPIERDAGDAAIWADGLDISLTDDLDTADAILLMGLPDGAPLADFVALLDTALARSMPVFCPNPDRTSPRAGGEVVVSPGTLAHDHAARGGDVRFYGKPYPSVFRAIETALCIDATAILMVGDSLEHDIRGACAAGWSTAFVCGGIHAAAFARGAEFDETLARLAAAETAPLPDFTMSRLE